MKSLERYPSYIFCCQWHCFVGPAIIQIYYCLRNSKDGNNNAIGMAGKAENHWKNHSHLVLIFCLLDEMVCGVLYDKRNAYILISALDFGLKECYCRINDIIWLQNIRNDNIHLIRPKLNGFTDYVSMIHVSACFDDIWVEYIVSYICHIDRPKYSATADSKVKIAQFLNWVSTQLDHLMRHKWIYTIWKSSRKSLSNREKNQIFSAWPQLLLSFLAG